MSEPHYYVWSGDPNDPLGGYPMLDPTGQLSDPWWYAPWRARGKMPLSIGGTRVRPFASGATPLGLEYGSAEPLRDPDADEREARHELLLQLADAELLQSRFDALFVAPRLATWRMRLNTSAAQPMREYVTVFSAISDLYVLLVSLQYADYFAQRWLRSSSIRLQEAHELRVLSITRASPDDIKVEGLSAGLKALGDALSIGKQYQEIRTAGEKIREAKAAARKVELEVEQAEGAVRVASAAESETLRLTIAKLRADMRMLQLQVEEEELKLRALRRKDLDESLVLLQKHAPVLEKLPEGMRGQVLRALTRSVSAVHDAPFDILEYAEVEAPAEAPT